MKIYHGIGFWSMTRRWNILPHPIELQGYQWDRDVKHKVLEYLKSGTVIGDFEGYAFNRMDINDDCNPELGSTELTDGYWVWPEGLSYYVSNFDVALPESFVKLANCNQIDQSRFRPQYRYFIWNRQWIRFSSKYRSHWTSKIMSRIPYVF